MWDWSSIVFQWKWWIFRDSQQCLTVCLYVAVFRSVLRGTLPVGRQHVWNISAKPAVSRSVRVFVQCSCVRSRFPVLPSSKYTICSRMYSSLLASFLQVLTEPISKWRDVRGHNPLVTYMTVLSVCRAEMSWKDSSKTFCAFMMLECLTRRCLTRRCLTVLI